jgi:hypothetical protein
MQMRAALLCAFVILFAGCSQKPPSRYAWGSYEDLIYLSYAAPGKLTPEMQVQRLEKDLLTAQAANKPMPPGWHAHLGYLYVRTGRLDLAEQQLLAEKAAFPESSVFVDRLLTNLQRAQ